MTQFGPNSRKDEDSRTSKAGHENTRTEVQVASDIHALLTSLKSREELRLDLNFKQVTKSRLPVMVTFRRMKNGNIEVCNGVPSTNGTFAHRDNSQFGEKFHEITDTVIVRNGDSIKLGEIEFQLGQSYFDSRLERICSSIADLAISEKLVLGRDPKIAKVQFDQKFDSISRAHCTIKKIGEEKDANGEISPVYQLSDGLVSDSHILVDKGFAGWEPVANRVELGAGRKVRLPWGLDKHITIDIPLQQTNEGTYDLSENLISSLKDIEHDSLTRTQLAFPGITREVLAKIPMENRDRALKLVALAKECTELIRNKQPEKVIDVLTNPDQWTKLGFQFNSVPLNISYEYIDSMSVKDAYLILRDCSNVTNSVVDLCIGKPTRIFDAPLDFIEEVSQNKFSDASAQLYLDILLEAVQKQLAIGADNLATPISKCFNLAVSLRTSMPLLTDNSLLALDRAVFLAEHDLILSKRVLDPRHDSADPGYMATALIAMKDFSTTSEQSAIDDAFMKLTPRNCIIIGLDEVSSIKNDNVQRITIMPGLTKYGDLEVRQTIIRSNFIRSQIAQDHIAIKEDLPGLYYLFQPKSYGDAFPIFYRDILGVWQPVTAEKSKHPTGTAIRIGSSFEFTLGPRMEII